jgi:tetratricopeptide (TPR) repeat protein
LIDHPGSEELAAFVRGELPVLRMREVVRHLLLPCPPCAAVVGVAMPAAAPEPVPEDEYDAALDRALQKALLYEESLRRRKAEARKVEELLARDGMKAIPDLPWETDPLAMIDALLARSWALRHDDPGKMVQLADMAVKQAQALDACEIGVLQMADVLCRTWAEMGNALRAADRYRDAWEALCLARDLFDQGTGDELLEMRITELEASLAADRRQFDIAQVKLTRVFRFHRRRRNHHLAGRTLILKGLYANYAGHTDEAIQLVRQGRGLLDPDRDTDLHYSAVHNELLCLVDSGRIRDAKRLRIERSRELSWGKGRVSEVRLRAVDGRLDLAEGKFARAEEALREAKQGYSELGRNYHAAITALDLAEVLLRRGRWVDAKEEALEAVAVFKALRIGTEAYATVIVLRDYFELRMVTPAFIQETAAFLRRVEHDPAISFTPPPSLRLP